MSTSERTILRPEFLWTGREFATGMEVEIANGVFERVGNLNTAPREALVETLPGEALIPGLINVHSHAFQRGLRGLTQTRSPQHPTDDFWTWREGMYSLVESLTPERVYDLSLLAFVEMLERGITTVGEFHYVHHDKGGQPYADRNEMSARVLAAAADAGIRIVLLQTAYARGGYRREANPAQQRFCDASVEDFLARTDASRHLLRSPTQTLGLAPHSVRACPKEWIEEILRANRSWKLPFHMHVQEQRREIAECKREYRGKTPLQMLEKWGVLTRKFTAIHATHTTPQERALLAKRQITVCACPTTERDLGDGILEADDLVRRGVPIAFGSDSQTSIDLFEEMRCLEGHLRLQSERRVRLADQPARALLTFATENGARALHLSAGACKAGKLADFFTLDLSHPSLCQVPRKGLSQAISLTSMGAAVRSVFVGGRRVVSNGQHPLRQRLAERSTALRLASK